MRSGRIFSLCVNSQQKFVGEVSIFIDDPMYDLHLMTVCGLGLSNERAFLRSFGLTPIRGRASAVGNRPFHRKLPHRNEQRQSRVHKWNHPGLYFVFKK